MPGIRCIHALFSGIKTTLPFRSLVKNHKIGHWIEAVNHKFDIWTDDFDTWRQPVQICAVGGKCHVIEVHFVKRTIQSCPIWFQSNSIQISSVSDYFPLVPCYICVTGELSWSRLPHVERPQSLRCCKIPFVMTRHDIFPSKPMIVLIGVFTPS